MSGADTNADVYFAARPPEEIGAAIFDRIKRNTEVRRGGERYDAQLAGYNHYYGYDFGSGVTWRIDRDGDVGELTSIRVNRSRTNARSLLGLLTAPQFDWTVKARNGDGSARSVVKRASNVLEYYWDTRGFELKVNQGVESAIVAAECFGFVKWNRQAGKQLNVEPDPQAEGEESIKQGKAVYEGDAELHLLMPWDCHWDEDFRSFDKCPWFAGRLYEPKWDVIEEYPLDIAGQPTKDAIRGLRPNVNLPTGYSRQLTGIEGDVIPVYYFFHDDTPAVPGGREVVLVSETCVLYDGPLRYPGRPIKRLVLEEQLDSTRGYSSWIDTLGMQELLDGLHTSIASNQSALATQSIVMEEGSKANIDAVSGLKTFYIKKGAFEPKALQLTATPKEVFEHVEATEGRARDMVGLNDVIQGQPQTAQMNAEAFNILASMAIQRAAPAQKQVLRWVSELGRMLLKVLETFVTEERLVYIAGKDASSSMQEQRFTGKDLAAVDAVIVTIGNALEQSAVGRLSILQTLLKIPGAVRNPQDVAEVIETGRLEPVVNVERNLELSIAAENETLHLGQVPPVLFSDDHLVHCRNHLDVVTLADVRNNPQVMQAWKTHFNQHYVEFFGLPPGMAPEQDPQYPLRSRLLLGQQPPPVAGPPAPMPGQAPAGGPSPHPGGPPGQPIAPPQALQPPGARPQGGPPSLVPMPAKPAA